MLLVRRKRCAMVLSAMGARTSSGRSRRADISLQAGHNPRHSYRGRDEQGHRRAQVIESTLAATPKISLVSMPLEVILPPDDQTWL
eukprot:594122-Pleurochrysis_carterae.AAC.1